MPSGTASAGTFSSNQPPLTVMASVSSTSPANVPPLTVMPLVGSLSTASAPVKSPAAMVTEPPSSAKTASPVALTEVPAPVIVTAGPSDQMPTPVKSTTTLVTVVAPQATIAPYPSLAYAKSLTTLTPSIVAVPPRTSIGCWQWSSVLCMAFAVTVPPTIVSVPPRTQTAVRLNLSKSTFSITRSSA